MMTPHAGFFGRDRTIYNPWHYLPVLVNKPGALRKVSEEVLRLINNGYALAAILVDMITTPLFRIKQVDGTAVKDENGAPVMETDADGSMVLNAEALDEKIAETRRKVASVEQV